MEVLVLALEETTKGQFIMLKYSAVQYSTAYWSWSIPIVQVADPAGDVVPVGQIKHEDDPMVLAYVPAAQGVHIACFQALA